MSQIKCVLILMTSCSLCFIHAPLFAFQNDFSPPTDVIDNICGPRCLHYVLTEEYHISVTLKEIIRDIPWDNLKSGVSAQEIIQAFSRYGINAVGIHTSPTTVLDTQHPCILHLLPESKSSIGHFVVLLPTTNRAYAQIWDRGRVYTISTWQLQRQQSGLAIVIDDITLSHTRSILTLDTIIFRVSLFIVAIISCFFTLRLLSLGNKGAK
jgi:ABC-type bacteriocin/lantibiotic exporter with double-glycine peptidase domain